MHTSRWFIAPLLALLVLVGWSGAAHAQTLPTPVGKVNDFAEVLQPADRAALDATLAELERTTTAEVAVVTVSSLDGRTVEDYATTLFNTWGIGKKGKDNGVLILVATDDRTMRIEVGYGLEGVLPDGLAGSIIRETFRPHFRNGDYRTGILEGTARIAEIVRRNETLTPAQLDVLRVAAREAGKSWGMAAFLGIFVAIGAFVGGTGAGARVLVQMLFGIVFAGLGVAGSTQVAPRPAVLLLGVVGVALFALATMLGRRPGWQAKIRGTTRRSGWMLNGEGRSSSSSSGSSGSSGSSFGGGRSGGGGASGSW